MGLKKFSWDKKIIYGNEVLIPKLPLRIRTLVMIPKFISPILFRFQFQTLIL